MMRPFTCLSLAAALGAGLYLYQEKHGAQLLDREISRTVHQADQDRDRIVLLKAEWALLNDPERLGSLAAQHLPLQPLQPAQYARMEDLRNRLPATPPAATATDNGPATPAPASMAAVAVPAPAAVAQAAAVLPVPPAVAPVRPAGSVAAPVSVAAVHPAVPKPAALRAAAAKPREPEPAVLATSRPVLAPVVSAYASAPPAVSAAVHAPTVQTASITSASRPFIGSALGMARTLLAAPVPVAAAATLGYAASR